MFNSRFLYKKTIFYIFFYLILWFPRITGKSVFLEITASTFEAGNFLNIFLWFWDFWGSFSYKKFLIEKKNVY